MNVSRVKPTPPMDYIRIDLTLEEADIIMHKLQNMSANSNTWLLYMRLKDVLKHS